MELVASAMMRRGQKIVWAVLLELAPAVLFGCAVSFASSRAPQSRLAAIAPLALGLVACALVLALLRRLRHSGEAFAMPRFERVEIEPDGVAELPEPELLLNDVLGAPEPQSRVVRLFDARPARGGGELQADVLPLCSAVRPIPTPPDATEALHDALAALRQSLR